MTTTLLIVTIILLGLVIFYITKLRKSVSEIRINQDLTSEDIAKKVDDINQRYIQQYSDIMSELIEYKRNRGDNEEEDDNDDMYEPVKELVIEVGKASTAFLQRKFGIGYSRAAHLMDMLEERGIIGPANGSKPREILIIEQTNN